MKNKKRALRRYRSQMKLERRIRLWYSPTTILPEDCEPGTRWARHNGITHRYGDMKHRMGHEFFTFLKTTSNPCNCYICSGDGKYDRAKMKKQLKKILFID